MCIDHASGSKLTRSGLFRWPRKTKATVTVAPMYAATTITTSSNLEDCANISASFLNYGSANMGMIT